MRVPQTLKRRKWRRSGVVGTLIAVIGVSATWAALYAYPSAEVPSEAPRKGTAAAPSPFAGRWTGKFVHSLSGEGRMDGAVGADGAFSGTFYDQPGRLIGSCRGKINPDGNVSLELDDAAVPYAGRGTVAINERGRLVGSINHLGVIKLDLGPL